MSVLAKLKKLSPREFEHLIYDLLVVRGMRNARWRTPGSDGGRDIQGDYDAYDFSGDIRPERWYVECKRYKKSVDWATVYEKVAFADNHQADFLLICTTGTLSPQCQSEVAAREKSGKIPRIRTWDGPNLELLLEDQPSLLAKYQLRHSMQDLQLSVLPLLEIVTKATNQSYAESRSPSRSVEFAAAVAELATLRMSDEDTGHHPADAERDFYAWMDVTNGSLAIEWDSYALRAFLSAVRFLEQGKRIAVRFSHSGSSQPAMHIDWHAKTTKANTSVLDAISLTANWEWESDGTKVTVRQRG